MGPLRLALVLLPLLLLAQPAYCLRRRLNAVSANGGRGWATPNYTIYHRQDDLLREVETLVKANPSFMKMEVLSGFDGNYSAELKVVTIEPGGFTDQQQDKIRMLLDFGEHGREFISSELGLLLLRTLADPEGVMRVWPADAARGRRLQELLRATFIKVLPMENEGGRRRVEAGNLCERKNGRGVDPNRNWPLDWGRKEPDYDPNEEYPGTAPFSEPEVRMLHDLASGFSPQVWLNIHSGMEAMFVPWDHKATVPDGAEDALRMLETIQSDLMQGTTCQVGSGGKTVGYLAHGTATDYMYDGLHVPVAYTWEIYGDFKAHFDDCFRMFNPLDEAGVQEVLQRWLRAIFRLLELLPSHPALSHSKAWGLASSAASTAGATTGAPASTSATAAGAATSADPSSSSAPAQATAATAAGQGQAGPQPAATGDPTTMTLGTGSAGTGATPQAGSGAGGGGSVQQQTQAEKQDGSAAEDELPRIAIVASSLGFGGGGWAGSLFSALLAVSGLAVIGVLLHRYCARGGPARRGEAYQAV